MGQEEHGTGHDPAPAHSGLMKCLSARRLPSPGSRAGGHAERNTGDQPVLCARAVEIDFDLVFVDREMFRDDLDNLIA